MNDPHSQLEKCYHPSNHIMAECEAENMLSYLRVPWDIIFQVPDKESFLCWRTVERLHHRTE